MTSPHDDGETTSSGRPRILRVFVCAVILAGAVILLWPSDAEPPLTEMLQEARSALADGNSERARHLADQMLMRSPESTDVLLISSQALLQLGRCSESESTLRRVLAQDPANVEAHQSLIRLLKMQGLYRELRPHALSLLRSGDSGDEYLIPLAAPDGITLSESEFHQAGFCRHSAPGDAAPLLGLARHMLWNAELERAVTLLRQIVKDAPDNIEAQALLGTAIQQLDDSADFVSWLERLPATADDHPEIWFLRGMRAIDVDQPHVAIRCFGEAVRRDSEHRRANFQLAQTLNVIGEPESAQRFSERFERLEEVARLATRGNDSSGSEMTAETMHRIGVRLEELGRLWEAAAWYRQALKRDPGISDLRARLEAVVRRLDETTPLTLTASNPAEEFHLAMYPLPDRAASLSVGGPATTSLPEQSAVSFIDRSESLALKFRFHNGADPGSGLARMFEFSGGGVGCIDFDGDLWPDLYLTQGCSWPPSGSEHRDRLFRNVSGERFADITEECRMGDELYSQGPTVGDFDNDGFADIVVANIGANRLYRNNGDGTFSDISTDAGIEGDDWTLSCLLADLNGDALPDLYFVNYLTGADVFTRKCMRGELPIQCPLQFFPSAQDRLFLNQGDGRFEDVTQSSGIVLPDGKGMGIVAADFQQTGRLSLFIANDDKPNFFLVNNAEKSGAAVSYTNNGIVAGLAFGSTGEAQSCMGVAAGDANNDGKLDLFVTNFANEYNSFYVQHAGGFFVDAAQQAGLHRDSLQPMGWGTQFIDGDLDGLQDLLVANGHLDENTAGILPYKMQTHFFRNLGQNRFARSPAAQLGLYFQQFHAGRAVARLDWNRDGADDACVTHVDSPVALLSNETANRGHYLSIRLRGVSCSRDAIGSVVRITAGDQTWYRHLTAGDGFQASNERKLTFGFGIREQIDEMVIHWPSGVEQIVNGKDLGPSLDREIIVVEGMPPRTMPRMQD